MARPRRIGLAPDLPEILEKAWDAQLFAGRRGLARTLGWNLCYHTLRSKGSQAGFPDRVLIRERVVFVELKRELTGKRSEDANRQATDSQREWLDGLAAAGAEAYLWRPSDLDEIGLVLGKRWAFSPAHVAGAVLLAPPALTSPGGETLRPRSAWIAGAGRADEIATPDPQETLLA